MTSDWGTRSDFVDNVFKSKSRIKMSAHSLELAPPQGPQRICQPQVL